MLYWFYGFSVCKLSLYKTFMIVSVLFCRCFMSCIFCLCPVNHILCCPFFTLSSLIGLFDALFYKTARMRMSESLYLRMPFLIGVSDFDDTCLYSYDVSSQRRVINNLQYIEVMCLLEIGHPTLMASDEMLIWSHREKPLTLGSSGNQGYYTYSRV
jgi:hypothetical protein